MKNEKAVLIRFNLLQVLYWCGFASMASFCSAFMLYKGMSNTHLGIVMALYMLSSFVGQLFWSGLCDKLRTNRNFFILNEVFVLVVYWLIWLFSDNFTMLYVFYPLLGFVLVPLSSNLDAWVLKCFAHRPEVYARSKGWSSGGFAIFMLVYGKLIDLWGYQIMPLFGTVFIGITVVVALLQPDAPVSEDKKQKDVQLKDIGKLAKSFVFVFIVILWMCIGFAASPIYNMKIVVLNSVGGDVSHQGYDSFFTCFFQLPFFFLAGQLRKIPQHIRLLVGATGALAMAVVDLLARTPTAVIFGSLLWGVGYSIIFPTVREIVEDTVDPAVKTTAHGICDAVNGSLAGIISLLYVGGLIDKAGTAPVFIICIVFSAVALLLCVLYSVRTVRNSRKQRSAS